MNTLIRVRGYVLGADVHEPTASFQTDKSKYDLLVHPELPDDWFSIQEIIDSLKWEYEQSQYLKPPTYEDLSKPAVKDRCFEDVRVLDASK